MCRGFQRRAGREPRPETGARPTMNRGPSTHPHRARTAPPDSRVQVSLACLRSYEKTAQRTIRARASVRLAESPFQPRTRGMSVGGDALPENLLQDPALADVLEICRVVDPRQYVECGLVTSRGGCFDSELCLWCELVEAADGERLLAGQAERRHRLAGHELEGDDPHHHEVRAV